MTGVGRPYHHESATALWLLLVKQRLRGVNPDRKSGVEPLRRPGEHSKPCRQLLQQRLHWLYWLAIPPDPASRAERGIVVLG